MGEKEVRHEGRKGSGKGGRWEEKRKEVVKEQSYKRVCAYLQLFFFNLSLLMDSVLYRVLLHQGQSLQSSEKNLRETSLKITMIKSTL